MRFRLLAIASLNLFAATALGQLQGPPQPDLDGYITRVTSPADFEVNGTRVLFDQHTEFDVYSGGTPARVFPKDLKPYVGEPAAVFGERHRKAGTISATTVRLQQDQSRKLGGSAIIDAVLPAPAGQAGAQFVRADGYFILIPASLSAPFATTNRWIDFHGTQRPDGILLADRVTVAFNDVGKREDSLRRNAEYDPASIYHPPTHGRLSQELAVPAFRRIPPYSDPALQARVTAIGEKLVPPYQRALPATDPTRIHFRFQLVNRPKWRDALTLPSGIILVPYQLVKRMQNDSQLATLLAGSVACAIEKQEFRQSPVKTALDTAEIATDLTGILVPGAQIAARTANITGVYALTLQAEEQRARVSLGLLHDAGYDIDQAPITWWLLASKTAKPLNQIPMPDRAAYLYKILGTTWRPS